MAIRDLVLLVHAHAVLGCTTIIAGKKATVDGSVMATHSNDGEGSSDPRLVYVPARDHAPGAQRPVFFAPENYPRYVGSARGDIPAYKPEASLNQSAFTPIGQIPEVSHTFAYFEETYGALNEHQVGIGESTCSGVFGTKPRTMGGKALFSVDTLTQLAMERATSSRAAVQLMGALAEAHGFYGAGSFEGTAESLLVTDPNEGFIFHILPDPTGTSAIWAAQRVPDEHVATVANAFVIREVNFSQPLDFLGSSTVHAVAQAKGWWKPSDGLLDFTAIYSDGEYAHKYYSGRRVWGVYHSLAKSLALSPHYDEWRASKPYPVSVPPDAKVSVADLAAAMRSYYEGTPFDQTVTAAAGPWGTPDHVAGGSAGGKVKGNWERTIGLYRTSDSYIVQSRGWLPRGTGGLLWFGAHAAPYTAYVPLALGMAELPAVTLGHPALLHKRTLFWAIRYLANYAQIKRNHMIAAIKAYQDKQHADALALVAAADASDGSARSLRRAYSTHAAKVVEDLWTLADSLMFKFADGYVTEVTPSGELRVTGEAYPDWWLKEVDYADGPPPVPPPSYEMV